VHQVGHYPELLSTAIRSPVRHNSASAISNYE
jgi:hypothetical protein